MTDRSRRESDAADDFLLAHLRSLAQRVDPVPPFVKAAARESLTWRTVDAELAQLTYDSLLDERQPAGVRAASTLRRLAFQAADLGVEVEVVEEGERVRLLGQIAPPQPASIDLQHAGEATSVEADELGRFHAAGLPRGPVRLRCNLGRDDTAVQTDWVSL